MKEGCNGVAAKRMGEGKFSYYGRTARWGSNQGNENGIGK
jgi:hypothetical protein